MIYNNREIFNRIYKYHLWVFGSGTGSVYWLNRPFVEFVNSFISQRSDIKTIIDIGCGDFRIGRHFLLEGKKYIGCDVSDVILNKVREKYSAENISFINLDAANDVLPDGDLAIVKDVLHHLSNEDVFKVLSKLKKYRYVIVANGVEVGDFVNEDVANGGYRSLDITRDPFTNSGYILADKYTEGWFKLFNPIRKLFALKQFQKAVFVNSEQNNI